MAFVKFKPLTPKFNFIENINIVQIPKYVSDYVENDKILFAYKTHKDVAVFTDKKIVLFNKIGIFKDVKEISTIPYRSIVTSAVYFGTLSTEIKLTLYNVYPLTLRFLSHIDKVLIKNTYIKIIEKMEEK